MVVDKKTDSIVNLDKIKKNRYYQRLTGDGKSERYPWSRFLLFSFIYLPTFLILGE